MRRVSPVSPVFRHSLAWNSAGAAEGELVNRSVAVHAGAIIEALRESHVAEVHANESEGRPGRA